MSGLERAEDSVFRKDYFWEARETFGAVMAQRQSLTDIIAQEAAV